MGAEKRSSGASNRGINVPIRNSSIEKRLDNYLWNAYNGE